jgi:hypothetical protein
MTEIGYIMAIQWGYAARHTARQNAANRDFAQKSDSFLNTISYFSRASVRRSIGILACYPR